MRPITMAALSALLVLILLLGACASGATPTAPITASTTAEETPASQSPTAEVTEMPEYTWSQLLSRDAILPIYDPAFVRADEATYDDSELVMGVVIGEEAKAYPVGPLNSREMVNDELAGIPILVTF